ncbi:alpha/beta hydrolase [Olleya sp. R77988]|uniref:alpha/beta hydrolase n=1 Tax=Olleya sp. R77988 TaxID=3093875 RepID=UPI0037CC3F04
MKNTYYLILLSLFVFACNNKTQPIDPTPKHDSFKIESKQVNETRVITVWTPPSYNNSDSSFPVLYMPDGGIKEDFPHIANTIAKLVKEKSIPPIILVGIENTNRRRDLSGASTVKEDEEYCPLTDGATNFRNFITQELFIEINKKYRVTNKKGIIGESLAGLFVMETFLQHPNYFDFYIAMDPSLWWNDHYLTKNANSLLKNRPNKNTKLWFAGSSAEDISIHTNTLAKTLEVNTSRQLTWKYSDEPNEKHNTIFRATKEKALKWSLNN